MDKNLVDLMIHALSNPNKIDPEQKKLVLQKVKAYELEKAHMKDKLV